MKYKSDRLFNSLTTQAKIGFAALTLLLTSIFGSHATSQNSQPPIDPNAVTIETQKNKSVTYHPLLLSTKAQQLQALEELLIIIQYQYAGLEIKIEQFGLSIEKLRDKYSKLINDAVTIDESIGFSPRVQREALSPEDARYLFVALVSELHDGHVSVITPEVGALITGIQSVALDGRLYVAGIHENRIQIVSEEEKPQERDEIIAINSRNVNYLKNRNLHYINNGTIEARKDEALERITEVPITLLPAPAKNGDEVKMTFRRGDKIFTNTYKWVEIDAIDLTRPVSPSTAKRRDERYTKDAPYVFGDKGSVRSYFYQGLLNFIDTQTRAGKAAPEIFNVGEAINFHLSTQIRKISSQFSLLGTDSQVQSPISNEVIDEFKRHLSMMTPTTRIQAYIISGLKKPIGVIRIPSYSPNGNDPYEMYKEINFIAQAIAQFKQVEGLDTILIDQLSNPGGATYYAHQLLSFFTTPEQPMKGLQAQLLLNKTLFKKFLSHLETSDQKHIDALVINGAEEDPAKAAELRAKLEKQQQNRRKMLEELNRQYMSGMRMSYPLAYGLDGTIDIEKPNATIAANENLYWDKKVVIIADERSASCGEIVPAMFQDNNGFNAALAKPDQRFLFFGAKTMGLGNPLIGHLGGANLPELEMRCPYAVCTRSNGDKIEGVGAIPDVVRQASFFDWQYGFVPYSLDVIAATLRFSDSESPREIQVAINQSNLGRQVKIEAAQNSAANTLATNTTNNNHSLHPNPKINSLLNELDANIKSVSDDVETNSNDFITFYTAFFDGLYALEQANEVSELDWSRLHVPLPQSLISTDNILKSSSRKDVILRRFEEIWGLEKYKDKPLTVALIKSLFRQAYKIKGYFHFNLPCHMILK